MTEQETELKQVWVFNGVNNHFPSAVFTERSPAEEWIEKYKLSGTLTAYPLNISVYDWVIEKDWFKPKQEHQLSPGFIASFSSAYQEHFHYGDEERE